MIILVVCDSDDALFGPTVHEPAPKVQQSFLDVPKSRESLQLKSKRGFSDPVTVRHATPGALHVTTD